MVRKNINQTTKAGEPDNAVIPETIATTDAVTLDESGKDGWREETREGIRTVMVNRDKVLIRVVVRASIDYMQNGGAKSQDYFEPRLKAVGLRTSGNKITMPAATLATRLDRLDPKEGSEAGKLLDAIASGMEGLVIAVGSDFPWAYSDQCIAALTAKVDEVGGLRKLADLARNENIDENPRGVIRLDSKKVRDIVQGRIANLLGDISTSSFALAVVKDGETATVPNISLDMESVTAALANQDIGEGRAQVLHELTLTTVAITLDDTGLVKRRDDDPKDKKSPKRQTEPHIVFRPDRSVIVAAHLANGASNMVRITDMPSPFDSWPDYDVILPPQVHRKLALNLSKTSQRNAVIITEEAPEADRTLAERTWHIRSEAALHPNYQLGGRGLLFSPRIPTYGRLGEPRDTVHVIREDRAFVEVTQFVCDFAPTSFLTGIIAGNERLKRAASTGKALPLSIKNGWFSVTISKENVLVAKADGTMDSIHVSAADFRHMLLLLEALKPSVIELSLDDQKAALRWRFRSSRAAYELFMPAATAAGTRLATAFRPISIVARPTI